MISESASTQLSLPISQSKGAGSADESKRHLCNLFHWRFPRRHRLCFRWLFLCQQRLRALTNPRVTCGSGFHDDFWAGSESVFVDYFSVNRCCGRWRIQTSPLESVSLMIWRRQWLSFHKQFLSHQRLGVLTNPRVTFERFLGDDFWVGIELVFVDNFLVNRGCWRWKIHASPSESVLLMISEMSMSQFSLTVSKSTGDELADESMPKVFCWRLPIQHRLKFYWLFWVNRQCEIF
jgi:hypothetical protein